MDFGRGTILCLGDSITEQGWGCKGGLGWVALLADAYRRRADLINHGYGGYTCRTLTPIALPLLAQHSGPPHLLTILFLGHNDSNTQVEQHVPEAEYSARCTALLVAAARVSQCVLCLGPGPVDNRRWPTRSNAAVARYNDSALAACQAARAQLAASAPSGAPPCPLLFRSFYAAATGAASEPVHAAVAEGSEAPPASAPPPTWPDLLSDGLHLSPLGNQLLAQVVLQALQEHAPQLLPHSLPMDFPPWNALPVDDKDLCHSAFTPEALQAFRKRAE
jgi:lysophospholipase L1-like esterase